MSLMQENGQHNTKGLVPKFHIDQWQTDTGQKRTQRFKQKLKKKIKNNNNNKKRKWNKCELFCSRDLLKKRNKERRKEKKKEKEKKKKN
jgi:hypothetical protein